MNLSIPDHNREPTEPTSTDHNCEPPASIDHNCEPIHNDNLRDPNPNPHWDAVPRLGCCPEIGNVFLTPPLVLQDAALKLGNPLFDAMGKNTVHCGAAGMGQA